MQQQSRLRHTGATSCIPLLVVIVFVFLNKFGYGFVIRPYHFRCRSTPLSLFDALDRSRRKDPSCVGVTRPDASSTRQNAQRLKDLFRDKRSDDDNAANITKSATNSTTAFVKDARNSTAKLTNAMAPVVEAHDVNVLTPAQSDDSPILSTTTTATTNSSGASEADGADDHDAATGATNNAATTKSAPVTNDDDDGDPEDSQAEDIVDDECVIILASSRSDDNVEDKNNTNESVVNAKDGPHDDNEMEATEKSVPAVHPNTTRGRRARKLVLKAFNRLFTIAFAILVVSPMFSEQMVDLSRFGRANIHNNNQRPPRSRRYDNHEDNDAAQDSSAPDLHSPMTSSNSPDQERNNPETSVAPPGGGSSNSNSVIGLDARRKMALSFVTEAVDKIGPSVVRIDTEIDIPGGHGMPEGQQIPSSGFVQQGQGSGLIISSDGIVLTNAHVVEQATRVSVTLTDGRVFTARVCGSDEITDVACLRLIDSQSPSPVSNLPVAELGDSDELQVGRLVIAIGSPGGLDNTGTPLLLHCFSVSVAKSLTKHSCFHSDNGNCVWIGPVVCSCWHPP